MPFIEKLSRRAKESAWDLLSGSGAYRLLKFWYGGMGSILMFHRVVETDELSPLSDNRALEVTPAYLEELILHFKQSAHDILSLDQVAARLATGETQRRFVSFTFDDGYADNYSLAYPIFKKHEVPFAIYVTTCFPERTAVLWWYLLQDVIARRKEVEFEAAGVLYRLKTQTPAEKDDAFTRMKAAILAMPEQAVKEFVGRLEKRYQLNAEYYSQRLAMSWDQIQRLAVDPLVTIGAHTRTHRPLARLDERSAREEISTSRDLIAQKIGKPVDHFAYPFGSPDTADEREFAMVKEMSFKTATTTRQGNLFAAHQELRECLPRFAIDEKAASKEALNRKICGYGLARAHHFQRIVSR